MFQVTSGICLISNWSQDTRLLSPQTATFPPHTRRCAASGCRWIFTASVMMLDFYASCKSHIIWHSNMWEGFSHYYLVFSPLSSSPRQPTWASWTTGNRKWKTWASTPATALSTLESLWQIWTSGRSRRSPKSWRSGWRRISGILLKLVSFPKCYQYEQ